MSSGSETNNGGSTVTELQVVTDTLPERALRYLGLHPENPVTWVLAALARRYGLDPLLNEVAVISTKQGARPYVTRDGLLTVAHRSGQFDGMTTDELREGEHGWAATVTVWRKDMSHGFTYSAGCGRSEPQAAQGHGAEMALARAERRALHRAFNVPTSAGEWDEPATEPSAGGALAGEVGTTPSPPRGTPGLGVTVPMMTPEQALELSVMVADLGLAGAELRTSRLAYLSGILGREVDDTRTITEAEAEALMGQARSDLAMLADTEPIDTSEPEPEPEGDEPL